jgi:Phosphopantetheine attachment site
MRTKIIEIMREIAVESGAGALADINDDTILLESGLDSMGFAILVARLEEDLGYDPFTMMDVPVYPRTLGEFVAIYQRYAP